MKKMIIMGTAVLLAGCAQNQDFVRSNSTDALETVRPGTETGISRLEGKFLQLSNTKDSLTDETLTKFAEEKILVLYFAQETCTTCAKEADALSAEINRLEGLPSNVKFLTILVGTDAEFFEDAADWSIRHSTQWSIGLEKETDSLFSKYFAEPRQVPSIVIQKPQEGIVFKHTGEVTLEQIREETGPWELPN